MARSVGREAGFVRGRVSSDSRGWFARANRRAGFFLARATTLSLEIDGWVENRDRGAGGRVRSTASRAPRRGPDRGRGRTNAKPPDSGGSKRSTGSRAHLLVGVHRALRRNFDLHQGTVRLEVVAQQLALLVSHLRDLGLCASRGERGGAGSVRRFGAANGRGTARVAATRTDARRGAGGRVRRGSGLIIFVPPSNIRAREKTRLGLRG